MTDPHTALLPDNMDDLSVLRSQLESETEKNQLALVSKLANMGESGLGILREFLAAQSQPANLVISKAYQVLAQASSPSYREFLQTHFPTGVIPLRSERNIDYLPLQKLLVAQDFQSADILTLQKLCELAGVAAVKRKWLYFTEVDKFPATDLQTIDQLWFLHSEGKFGFSVQRQIWLSVGQDFNKLWTKIAWKDGNNWTRYPTEFIWDLSAPKGHLPTSNQLRGVKVINALFAHPVWTQIEKPTTFVSHKTSQT